MHFTGTVYRNPYWETFPLLQITQGCTHNKCKFCTMYRDVPFKVQPRERRLRDMKPFGCPGHVFLSCDGKRIA